MQFLKRIQPLFLSFTLIACCLTFQSDSYSSTAANNYSSWIVNSLELSSKHDVYKIKLRRAETVLGNNFSIFSFKCFLKQRKSLFATNYKQQQLLVIPQQSYLLRINPQTSNSEDDIFIG